MAFIKKKSSSVRIYMLGVLIFVVGIAIAGWLMVGSALTPPESIVIKKGDSPASIARALSWWDATKLKLYLRNNPDSLKPLQIGTYQFSGAITPAAFIQQLNKGPSTNYTRMTVLEGWSIYDIDKSLADKGRIQAGEYIARTTSSQYIREGSQTYPFLKKDIIGHELTSLEGFLYPDTYFIDISKSVLDQLISLQLKNFNEKIRTLYLVDGAAELGQRLRMDGLTSFQLSPYEILTLATVIEKEERNPDNKPTVAGIFLNRLQQGMRLDADITLCYGLKQPYETCTPSFIAQGIYDKNNVYNTRQLAGIPPTPIANPSFKSVDALIHYKKTDNLFYLHAPDGQIYYGRTYEEHNNNKRQYLQ